MSEPAEDIGALQAVSSGNSKFAFHLHNVLNEANPNSNLVHSPFSLRTVLAMVKQGARGQTGLELQEVCHFPPDDAMLAAGYKKLLVHISGATCETAPRPQPGQAGHGSSYESLFAGIPSAQSEEKDPTLATAIRLYVQSGFQVSPEFETVIRDKFVLGNDDDGIKQLDFGKSGEAAAAINGWVRAATMGKIQGLISPRDLNTLTRLVLVNGVYFRGVWQVPFGSHRNTKKKPFKALAKSGAVEEIEVDMMEMMDKVQFPYAETVHARVLELPYRGEQFAMLLFLPKETDGLTTVQKEPIDHEALVMQMTTSNVTKVYLPRFRVESAHQFVGTLRQMGLATIFDHERADLSGISKDAGLHVSQVFQEVFIVVDEEGTLAVAATGFFTEIWDVVMDPTPTIVFNVDHAFMFEIIHKPSLTVIFKGCVTNPTTAAA